MSPQHNRRSQTDRRVQEDYPDIERILNHIEAMREPPAIVNTSNKGDQITFTLTQIATGLLAILTIGGGMLGAWGTLNSQIASQKVATDLIIEQLHKDVTALEGSNKDNQSKMDNITTTIQSSIKELTNRVVELDNTVNQLYNRTSPKI